MSLRSSIEECKNCPLYQNMTISPVPYEIIGNNKNIIAICIFGDKTKKYHDINQKVLTDIENYALSKIVKKYNIGLIITRLVKCITLKQSYTKKEIRECSNWLADENMDSSLITIGFGAIVKSNYSCHFHLPTLSKILESSKLTQELEKLFYDLAK